MKRILSFIFIIGFVFTAAAQQQMMFTQYMYNTQSFNPAYVGTQEKISAVLLAREQWVGLEGAPSTQTFTVNLPIRKHKVGLGFSVLNDMLGPTQEMNASIDFSYIVKLGDKSRLSLGIKGGLSVYQTDLTQVKIHTQNDIAFSQNMRGEFMPNFGAGVYFYTPSYYIGLAVPRLVKNKISVTDAVESVGRQEIHYFLHAGYIMELSSGIKFRPSLLIKYVEAAPLSVDLAANFLISDRFWLGGSYRIDDALSGIVQYGLTKNLWLGYSYGYSLSEIMQYNSGTHEVMLMYDFAVKKRKFRSPRYF